MFKPIAAGLRGIDGRRRGVALLVALGVLVVLALLGAVFATLTGIERSVARNYIDKVRARFLAESGVEAAFAKLSSEHGHTLDLWSWDPSTNGMGPNSALPWVYCGLDLNGNGLVDAGESGKYSYTLPSGEVMHDWSIVPLEEAVRPSFSMDRNGNGAFDAGDLLTIDSLTTGISGKTDVGAYSALGNLYALKVTDLQSRININNRHTHLATIVNNLARRLGLPPTIGDTILAARARLPGQTLTTLDQLMPALPRATIEKLRPHLTVNGWLDEKVIKPIGLTAGKRRKDVALGGGVYSYHELRPREIKPIDPLTQLPSEDFEPRSPVNINTAPFEVLASLVEGLTGFYLQEFEDPWTDIDPYNWIGIELSYTGTSDRTSGKVGKVYQTPVIGPKTADNIAREILKARIVYPPLASGTPVPQSVFRSYQQLARFFDELPATVFDSGEISAPPGIPIDVLHNEIRDLLKANFDPNCHLNELNPDEMLHLKIDKTDLFYWTTELCFFPMGHFEVESLGRVVDSQQREVASAKVYVHAKLFDVHRDSTQADFQRDFILNDLNTAIDLPSSRGDIETRLSRTFSSSGAGAYPFSGHMAAYPEYFLDPQHVKDSSYDGYVALLNKAVDPRQSTLRARFMPPNDSDSPSTALNALSTSGSGLLIRDAGGGPWYDKLIGGAQPGSLMVDGCFSEKDTSPAYPNANNFNQHVGTLSFWVKPAFAPERAGKIRMFFSAVTYDMSGYTWGGPSNGLNGWPMNAFGVCYLANHNMTRYPENTHPVTYDGGNTHWPTRSIAAGFGGSFNRYDKFWAAQPVNADGSIVPMRERVAFNASGTLNHIGHPHDSIMYLGDEWGNFLVQGRWMHLGLVWNDSVGDPCKVWLYVNGLRVERTATGQNLTSNYPNTLYGEKSTVSDPANPTAPAVTYLGLPADIPDARRYLSVVGIPPPPLRLGGEAQTPLLSNYIKAVSGTYAASHTRYPGNYPADATIDEFLTWPGLESTQNVMDMWMEGRFYKSYGTPNKTAANGTLANFTSARISVKRPASKTALRPPRGTATLPGPFTPPPPPGAAAAAERVQLGLVAYTLRVPDYPRMGIKYPSNTYPLPKVYFDVLDADTRASLLTGGGGSAVLGNVANSALHLGGGAVTDDALATGAMVTVDTTSQIRYRFWLDAGLADRLNDPFMATPVVDDVTVTYSRMKPDILAWWVND